MRLTARATAALALAVTASGTLAAPAGAQSSPQPFAPWDGANPFECELQDVGTGTDYPHPEADPFCVKFDKTNQNVTDFGLVDFLSQEPARTAAASPKCFYFQRDEWTGSIQQGSEPELWHWNGNYFFDKARGVGGMSVRDYRVGGTPQSAAPYAPPAYQSYFDESGGGGFIIQDGVAADPSCARKVDSPGERASVYGDEQVFPECIPPGGELRGRQVGRVRLGMQRQDVLARLGEPRARKHDVDRWCVVGGDNLRIAYGGRRERAEVIRTSVHGHDEKGVAPGSSLAKAKRRLDAEPVFERGDTTVLEGRRRADRRLFVGARGHRVRWLAIADEGLRRQAVKAALRRADRPS